MSAPPDLIARVLGTMYSLVGTDLLAPRDGHLTYVDDGAVWIGDPRPVRGNAVEGLTFELEVHRPGKARPRRVYLIGYEDRLRIEASIDGLPRPHRVYGPAIIAANGDETWMRAGEIHRSHGPAIERVDGSWDWYSVGARHRTNGPASRDAEGHLRYFLQGRQVGVREYLALTGYRLLSGRTRTARTVAEAMNRR